MGQRKIQNKIVPGRFKSNAMQAVGSVTPCRFTRLKENLAPSEYGAERVSERV